MRNIEMDGRHKETPLVCIAITCYNHEKYVRQALESAINQTYDNTVILISDDGSKDQTRDIIMDVIKDYPEKNVNLFFSESNMAFDIVEKMDSSICGKYLLGFSGDDYIGETVVEKCVDFMESHEECAISFSVPEIIVESPVSDLPAFTGENMNRYELFESLFCNGNSICASPLFARSSVWKTLGCYHYQYKQLQDYEKWLYVLQENEVHIFGKEELPTYYRIHENSLSNVSIEVIQRDAVEREYLLFHVMDELAADFFLKVFGKYLLHPADSEAFCLNCEKLMILIRAEAVPVKSVIWYYFSHIGDPEFSEHIERDYHFTRKDFWNLTGELDAMLINMCNEDIKGRYLNIIEKQEKVIAQLMDYCKSGS